MKNLFLCSAVGVVIGVIAGLCPVGYVIFQPVSVDIRRTFFPQASVETEFFIAPLLVILLFGILGLTIGVVHQVFGKKKTDTSS